MHHHLVRAGTRLRAGLVIESGEPRAIHDMATLIGYGASAINPYLMFESLDELAERSLLPVDLEREEAERRIVTAIGKGLLKTISKMGISTMQSYCGAQIFEAVGLEPGLVERHFTGTASRIGGIGMDVLAREALERHFRAYPRTDREVLPVGGVLQWRRDGEHHIWNPDTIARLQHAVNADGEVAEKTYREWAEATNEETSRRALLRGLLRLRDDAEPIPLEEVEPASDIVRRFSTGAMSLGSISPESHEALAIAMNRIGGKSNTGEGGEDPRRFTPDANGDERRSAIKQIASGRFGVTIDYLVNADQLQIKMAQGAKPGEGGQLPGHKVDDYIAYLRHSTPGVGLISPPPHHDIYSIEDLKQLIYDLRCANPDATVSVKLVSEVGVGTVAAGRGEGERRPRGRRRPRRRHGRLAAVLDHLRRLPWEIGLAETQQTLLLNDLRSRITGRGRRADEDRPRRRHRRAARRRRDRLLDRPADRHGLRDDARLPPQHLPGGDRHAGPGAAPPLPRHARARRHVPLHGGRGGARAHGLARGAPLRRADRPHRPPPRGRRDRPLEGARGRPLRRARPARGGEGHAAAPHPRPGPGARDALDWELVAASAPALERGERVRLERRVRNVNRTVGGILSGEIARRLGANGLPEGTIEIAFAGSAGQSFGAWLARGVSFTLQGETNDYAGKGLSGGILTVRPPESAGFRAEENVIVGNTVLYGATAGRAFFRGLAGERFAVRNSGRPAVVEGVGDHGCEYMTGGRVVVLGPTGRNFAAGMSGGIAYVLRSRRDLRRALQPGARRPRPARGGPTRRSCASSSASTRRAPARRSPGVCSPGGTRPWGAS